MTVADILDKITADKIISEQDIAKLLCCTDDDEQQLFSLANQTRQSNVGNEIHFRGLIEFANFCSNDCYYCGLRRSNKKITRYRMTDQEIIETGQLASRLGYRTLVLQSGEYPDYSAKELADLVYRLKTINDFAITLSIGQRSLTDYQLLLSAGADRILMRHETSDSALFTRLRPGTNLTARLSLLTQLRELGYQIGLGNMVGLPGQSLMSIVQDILLIQTMNADMAGIGPFLPHPQTPLAACNAGSYTLSLHELAIVRLLVPRIHLPATTALATICPDGQLAALNCGANVLMPNLTPHKYRKLYTIYPNKAGITEDPLDSHQRLLYLVGRANRTIASDRGDSLQNRR